jgi:formate hydrogenlyase subunit 3/multisubunit Na+/H+ antiporter MnhD subunit
VTTTVKPRHDSTAVAGQATNEADQRASRRLLRPKPVALLTATTLVSINIWTGFPLLALWIGSRLVPQSGLSMSAVIIVVVLLAVMSFASVVALTWLSSRYDEITGRPLEQRRTSPWLRSMRGEREELRHKRLGLSPLERIVIVVVVAAAIALQIWFFFFAGPPLLS